MSRHASLILLVGFAATQQAPAAQTPSAPPGAGSITHQLSEVRSGSYRLDHDHARLIWNVSHHGYSTFSAMFGDVSGKLELDAADPTRSRLEASVNMTSVGTLIPDFDTRLKGADWFNTAKFPLASFKSTKISITAPNTLRVSGELTFLGITKPAVLDAHFNEAGDGKGQMGPPGYRVGFDGHMVFQRSDFGMEPSTVGDQVTLQIEAEFEDAGAKPAS